MDDWIFGVERDPYTLNPTRRWRVCHPFYPNHVTKTFAGYGKTVWEALANLIDLMILDHRIRPFN